MISC